MNSIHSQAQFSQHHRAPVEQQVLETEDLLTVGEGLLLMSALGAVLVSLLSFSWL